MVDIVDLRIGDCLKLMHTMRDNSIDLTVTSPPYDDIRDYKGYAFDFEGIARELFRITKAGGVVVWVVGDAQRMGVKPVQVSGKHFISWSAVSIFTIR